MFANSWFPEKRLSPHPTNNPAIGSLPIFMYGLTTEFGIKPQSIYMYGLTVDHSGVEAGSVAPWGLGKRGTAFSRGRWAWHIV